MFTKSDFINFLEQVKVLERKMKLIYKKIGENVDSPDYKEIFLRLVDEEQAHEKSLDRITSLLEKIDR